MQIIDAATTRAALPFERLIPALRAMFRAEVEVPQRQVLEIAPPGEPCWHSLIMPAWQAGRAYGVKIVNVAPGNAARGLPGLHASYLLHDGRTGVPLALLDGDEITARRTAAASALAADWLARADAAHLLLVGAGRVARLLPAAYRCVRPIRRVSVWARSGPAARALAAELAEQGFAAAAVDDLQAAVRAADITSCATLAREPLVRGAWLGPGSHLDLIGSFAPEMREADDDALRGARVFVDTEEALHKSGDLLGPMASGAWQRSELQGTLAGLCRDAAAGRATTAERTVFKSVGTALEDLAAALLAMDGLAPAA